MNKDQIKQINYERMNRWKDRLNENHSTPVMTIGVGHDHVNGRLMVLVTEERSDEEIRLLLLGALKQLGFD